MPHRHFLRGNLGVHVNQYRIAIAAHFELLNFAQHSGEGVIKPVLMPMDALHYLAEIRDHPHYIPGNTLRIEKRQWPAAGFVDCCLSHFRSPFKFNRA